MSPLKKILCFLTIIFVSMISPGSSEELTKQPDPLCQQLFDIYFLRNAKINWSSRVAASHLIAERGRDTGFWKDVLQELQSGKKETESGCVLILGKMLAIDAAARAAIKREKETGQRGQWVPSVSLDPQVAKELVARGNAADRWRIDDYAIALLRARIPDATEFFRTILRDNVGKHYMASSKFHAAVGLAQLGESDGFLWLIKNSADPLPTVSNAWPIKSSSLNLDTCSTAALRELSGEKSLKSKQDWELWWHKVDKNHLPKNSVHMTDCFD